MIPMFNDPVFLRNLIVLLVKKLDGKATVTRQDFENFEGGLQVNSDDTGDTLTLHLLSPEQAKGLGADAMTGEVKHVHDGKVN